VTTLLHRLGLWEPWKFIEVDGGRYNCWEIRREMESAPGAHAGYPATRAPHAKVFFMWQPIRGKDCGGSRHAKF
jgi:hypothetical protein